MPVSFIVTSALVFFSWFVAALLSQAMGESNTQTSAVWLATGITFGALMVARTAKWPAIALGAAAATIALGLLDGQGVLASLAFGVNEALSAALGAWVARQLRAPAVDGSSDPVKAYASLLLGAAVTAAFGGSIAIGIWSLTVPNALLATEWRVWLCTTFVGILLVAPLIISFASFRPKRSGGMPTSRFITGALAYLLFFVVAALIFSSDVSERFSASLGPTLTYLPLPFIVITAILWKDKGASLATLLAAVALIVWTNNGGGPFAEIEGFAGEAVIEVQGYVAAMALMVGFVTALGALGEQALAQAQTWRTRYRQVLESSRTVAANFDAHNGQVDWTEGAGVLLRTDVTTLQSIHKVISHADPLQQAALLADWTALAQGQTEHAVWKTALRWNDRSSVNTNIRLSSVRGADGQVEQVVALFEVEA